MLPMQVAARFLSPRDAILALLLAATPLVPATSGSVTADGTTLALGQHVSDTLQLGRSRRSPRAPRGELAC
jgi:hypothetical protein